MSEAVESFNDKIDEIKEDKEKFEILVGEFFDSKDINIKELLAEMMLHVIMTRGEELQIKFKELEDRRSMYGDWIIGDQHQTLGYPNLGINNPNNIILTGAGTAISPPSWTYTSNNTTYIASSNTLDLGLTDYSDIQITNTADCFNIEDLNIGSLVENVTFEPSETSINTKLFQDAVTAMATWSSSTAE